MAGRAEGVSGETVVWLRYHVASSARAAKPGQRSSSRVPSSASSEAVGSSSSTTMTTGAGSASSTAGGVDAPADDERTHR